MNKKILRKISNPKNINITKEKCRYVMSAEIMEIEEVKTLVLNFYSLRFEQAEFRTFLNRDDYITQDLLSENKWKTGALYKILDIYCFRSGWENIKILDKKSNEALCEFLENDNTWYEEISRIQNRIMDRRLKNKYRKLTDPIDEKMKCIESLPIDFDKWISDVAFAKSKYIYYQYKAKSRELDGYCTHCKLDIKVNGARHNNKGICPNCNSLIIYKAIGKSKWVRDDGQASIIQKIEEGFVLRVFAICKRYDSEYRCPSVSKYEIKRVFYENDTKRVYEYAEFRQSGNTRWCNDEYKKTVIASSLYDSNLDIIEDSKWRHSALKEIAISEVGYKFNVGSYLDTYKGHPILEKLVKVKLYNAANDFSTIYLNRKIINENGKSINEILKLEKYYLKLLQNINVTLDQLEFIQQAINRKIKITENEIRYIKNNNINWKLLLDMTKYKTIKKILRYLETQKCKEISIKDMLVDWRDYVENCEELKYNLKSSFIIFPKNLREQHDITSEFVLQKNNEKNDQKIREIYEKIKDKYVFENKNYEIKVADTAMKIIKEGQELRHCVGNYIKKVINKETIILFVRQKENLNKSYYTMEIVEEKIVQCRGFKNKSYSEDKDLVRFINRFDKEILIPLRNNKKGLKIKKGA